MAVALFRRRRSGPRHHVASHCPLAGDQQPTSDQSQSADTAAAARGPAFSEHPTLCEPEHLVAMRAEVDECPALTKRHAGALPVHLVEFPVTMRTHRDEIGPVNQSPRRLRCLRHDDSFRQLLIVSRTVTRDQPETALVEG